MSRTSSGSENETVMGARVPQRLVVDVRREVVGERNLGQRLVKDVELHLRAGAALGGLEALGRGRGASGEHEQNEQPGARPRPGVTRPP
jgi:hypothetical protein